jgi:hypothetical protein
MGRPYQGIQSSTKFGAEVLKIFCSHDISNIAEGVEEEEEEEEEVK